MEKKKIFESARQLTLLSVTLCILCASILVVAAVSFMPEKRGDGNSAESIYPSVSQTGDSAELLVPEIQEEGTTGDTPREPFVPEFEDDEPFVDMDVSRDFSTQYDYSFAGMYAANGAFESSDGTFTATTANAMNVHMSSYAPFPYGTISADVMNNGSDSGIVFGLSTVKNNFWEGAGVSYYFAFVHLR